MGEAMAGAAVLALLISSSSWAASIPIVQGNQITVGAMMRQPVPQPSESGFTSVSATSSNPQVVQINGVSNPTAGFSSVRFSVTGVGVAVITVTFSNPATDTLRNRYFVVASSAQVSQASKIVIAIGDTMVVPAPQALQANAYVGSDLNPSTTIASPQVMSDGVQITGQSAGTSFVYIQLQGAGSLPLYEVVIVTVIAPGTVPQFE